MCPSTGSQRTGGWFFNNFSSRVGLSGAIPQNPAESQDEIIHSPVNVTTLAQNEQGPEPRTRSDSCGLRR